MSSLSFRGFLAIVILGFGLNAQAVSDGACTANPSGVDTGSVEGATSGLPKTSAAIKKYVAAQKKCVGQSYQAQMKCIAACSGTNAAAIAQQGATQGLMSLGRANSNANLEALARQQQGDKMKQIMGECNPPMGGCSSQCPEAKQALQEAQSAVAQDCMPKGTQPPPPQCSSAPGAISAQLGKESSGPQSTEGRKQECDGKMKNDMKDMASKLADVLKALADALKNADQNKAGDTASAAADPCLTDPTTKDCICKDPAQARNPICVNGSALDPAGYAATNPSTKTEDASDLGGSGGSPEVPSFPATEADASVPAGGGDAGGSLAGAGGNSAKDAAKNAEDAKKPALSAGILTGVDGGGGNYGGGGGLGDSSESGGKRKPGSAFKISGSAAPPNIGLTRAGGRSNWEKVRTRYADSTPTLLKDDKSFFSSPVAAPSVAKAPVTPAPAATAAKPASVPARSPAAAPK